MKRRVVITKAPLPKAQQGLYTKQKLTNNAFQFPVTFKEGMEPNLEVKKNLGPVPRDKANIEAEKGETILTPMGDDAWTKTLPKTYVIGGKKHSKGGTPLDVPEGSFIFSDHLKERNTKIHEMLGKAAKKSGYTYAELSKPYMLNDDIKVLLDPDSDRITRETAELNIKNKTDKLGMIALLQEASKGFSDDEGNVDIPTVGVPYLDKTGVDISDAIDPFLQAIKQPVQQPPMEGMQMPPQEMMQQAPQMPMGKLGGLIKFKEGGSVPKYQDGSQVRGTKLKAGERVVFDPRTQQYQIVNAQGNVVGSVSFTQQESTKLTRQQVPAGAVVLNRKEYEADKEAAFSAAGNRPLVIKNDDGTYRAINKKSALGQYQGDDFDTIFAGNRDLAARYKYVEDKFNDPEFKKLLSEYAIQALGVGANRGKNVTSQEAQKLKKKLEDPEFAYKMFMDMQKRNFATFAHEQKGTIKKIREHKDAADPGKQTNQEFIDSWTKIGLNIPTEEEAKMQQALYIGYKDLLNNRDKLKPEQREKLKEFKISQVGAADTADLTGSGGGPGKVSIIDGDYTNTTTGELAYVEDPYELVEGDLAPGQELMKPNPNPDSPEYVNQKIRKGWTAPNIYELYRTTKELYGDQPQEPWMAAPATYLPRAYLMSPEDMQRNYRGMAMGAGEQLMSMGMGPQAMAAITQLAGADQMAQYTSQIHNANQEILNNAERDRGNRIQTAFQNFANVATTLHDRWAQLKDNIQARKSAARAEVSKAYQAGEQAEMDMQALQIMYPNYGLDPFSMDYAGFIPTGPFTPSYGRNSVVTDRAIEIQSANPGMTYAEGLQYAKAESGIDDGLNQNPSSIYG